MNTLRLQRCADTLIIRSVVVRVFYSITKRTGSGSIPHAIHMITLITSSTRTRRGGSCLRDIYIYTYIRPFSSIELACAVRQPSPCVRALCETGVLFHMWGPMSHFKLHFTLDSPHTPHYTLHTALFTLHSSHCTLRSQHLTSHCTLKTPHFTLHTPHFTLHTALFALQTSHFALQTSHFTVHTSRFTLHTSHCTLHALSHCTLQHSKLHTSHFTLHSSRPTLHTALFTPHTSSHLSSSHLIPAQLFSSHLFSYVI